MPKDGELTSIAIQAANKKATPAPVLAIASRTTLAGGGVNTTPPNMTRNLLGNFGRKIVTEVYNSTIDTLIKHVRILSVNSLTQKETSHVSTDHQKC